MLSNAHFVFRTSFTLNRGGYRLVDLGKFDGICDSVVNRKKKHIQSKKAVGLGQGDMGKKIYHKNVFHIDCADIDVYVGTR